MTISEIRECRRMLIDQGYTPREVADAFKMSVQDLRHELTRGKNKNIRRAVRDYNAKKVYVQKSPTYDDNKSSFRDEFYNNRITEDYFISEEDLKEVVILKRLEKYFIPNMTQSTIGDCKNKTLEEIKEITRYL